ncbi:MAG: T9SS type A sorting domain-containing protein, partial [Chitinophagales bacterium]|nr:T9SS type A sorting domain-containing protein [Chitinophagales bacterium]
PGATLDMSVVGQYSFEITTNLVGDINPANNTITKTREKIALSGGTATVSQSDLCVSGVPPTLSSTLVEGYTSVQWQSSTTSGSGFSDIAGATSIDYTLPSIPGTNMYYRLVATCGTNTSNSSEIGVTVNDPQLTSTTPGSHCGPGSVNLGATATGGYTVNWYENPTGGVAIGTGSTFTTPPITSTTTFYAAASTGPGGPTTAQIGNGSSVSTSYEGPYYHLYGNKLSQYLFLASELTTAGMTAGTINSIAFDVVAPGVSYNNFTIGLKATNASVMTNTLESGLTTVYSSASETPVAGINTYTFTTPFVWDGVSNVIVQVCWTNNNNGGTSATVKYETTSFVSNGYWREDGAPVDFCTKTAGYGTTSSRPNTVFGFSNICEGVRTPVVATITSAPAITASATVDTICNGNSTTLSVTSSNSTYAYSWEPGTLIGATQTVSPTATTKYIVNAIDNSGGSFNGCTSIDSVTIAVYNPVPVTINTTATEVCATSNPAIKMFVGLTDIPVLSEDFETGAIDWTTTNNSTGGTPANAAWTIHPSPTTLSAQSVSSNDNSHFYHTNSDAQGSGSQANTTLTSPTFSTVGFTTLSLEFYHYYRHLTAPAAFVKVSTDGGNTWTTVYTSPNATVGGPSAFVKETINLDAFIDKQTVNIQFAYITTGWWYGWAIDNVLVSGTAVGSPSWAPTTGLFTDAAATTPYTGGIADTVYALPTATTTYTASVTTPGNCISSESVTITDTCSVVPVTFTSFTGKKEGTVNVLSWTTATEVNNAGYELQRSADGKQFSKLDFIATKAENGNSNTALSYGYNDNKPLAGNNYYRLKQMDKDGKSSYSNVVILKGDKANQVSITGVYPNPTRNTLNVNIASPSSERVSIVITDISGKVLVQQNVELNAGDNVKQIDVSRLSQGTYLIKTICANGCESAVTKFAKY